MNKSEMINILTKEYGYSESDLQDKEGKMITNSKLQKIIDGEEENKKEYKEAKDESIEANAIFEEKSINTIEQMKESITSSYDVYESINDDDMIMVMNGCSNTLIHRSKRTGRMWKFTRFGQIDKMPFIELVTIHNNNPKCFEQGKIVILDERVAKNFDLTDLYKHIVTPKNLDEIFSKSIDELEQILPNLPIAMRKTFVDRARELYSTNKIDSVKLIRFIENFFKISLEDNAPISDIV